MHYASRFHDISAGHRVVGHENKCRHMHGHNYRIHFRCVSDNGLDSCGRVIDFGVIKEKLCMWLEEHWDHKFLVWKEDPLFVGLMQDSTLALTKEDQRNLKESIVFLDFNPTAENMAQYLVNVIGPQQLDGTGIVLENVLVEETAKCHAGFFKEIKDA